MAGTGGGRAFPEGFTWGTATAAHQIEGGNTNNDWWAFEHTPGSGCAEPSGDACDSWDRWGRMRTSWPASGSTTTASRWSGAALSRPRASSPEPRWRTITANVSGCASEASIRS